MQGTKVSWFIFGCGFGLVGWFWFGWGFWFGCVLFLNNCQYLKITLLASYFLSLFYIQRDLTALLIHLLSCYCLQ